MSREIKFRGQGLKGQWYYGLLCNDKTKDSDYEWFISNSVGKPYAYGCIEKTIGQFTGFCDCRNNEIYEGDLVLGYRHPRKVMFEDGAFYIENKYGSVRLSKTNNALKVIGNIYENPELLPTN